MKLYSLKERVPKHGERIYLYRGYFREMRDCTVNYPHHYSPEKYNKDYYEIHHNTQVLIVDKDNANYLLEEEIYECFKDNQSTQECSS